jgi:hypothetical protein
MDPGLVSHLLLGPVASLAQLPHTLPEAEEQGAVGVASRHGARDGGGRVCLWLQTMSHILLIRLIRKTGYRRPPETSCRTASVVGDARRKNQRP